MSAEPASGGRRVKRSVVNHEKEIPVNPDGAGPGAVAGPHRGAGGGG